MCRQLHGPSQEVGERVRNASNGSTRAHPAGGMWGKMVCCMPSIGFTAALTPGVYGYCQGIRAAQGGRSVLCEANTIILVSNLLPERVRYRLMQIW